MVSIGNVLYALGGSNLSGYLDSVEYYDSCTLKWVMANSLPCKRYAPAAITLSKKELNQ